MIIAALVAPNIVRLDGINLFSPDKHAYTFNLARPERWRREIEKVAIRLQARIAVSYSHEAARDDLPFKTNSPEWTAFKVAKGLDARRGHMFGRIAGVLKRVHCYGISAISGASPVFITFAESKLQALAPHAVHYARRKVPNGRILQLNPAWLPDAVASLQVFDNEMQKRELKRWERSRAMMEKMARISEVGAGRQTTGALRRKPLTLALTAWSAVAKASAKLNLLGRI